MLQETSRPGVFDTLREITAAQTARERLLTWRYPWFNVVYNYLIALLVFALACSLYGWGLDVWAQSRADAQTKDAVEAVEKKHEEEKENKKREEEEAKKEELDSLQAQAKVIAKAFYGIRKFVEKYHYDRSDLETYARCIFNRYDAGNGLNSIYTIVSRPDQFTGYSDNNTVLTEDETLAMEFLQAWKAETSKPCDLKYQCAELTPDGIFLVTKPNAGPYERRWHA